MVSSPREPRRRSSRPSAAALVAFALISACSSPPTPPASIDRVVQRLDAPWFPGVPVPRHGPVAQIGDEARHVVRAPEEILVAEAFGVTPRGGKARVEVELGGDLARLPQSAFVLAVQELPLAKRLAEEVLARVARENFSLRRDRGWRLLPSEDPQKAVLELDHEGDEAVQINLRLTVLGPAPESLESERFDVPPAARLHLGFGLSTSQAAAEERGVEFVASLRCGETAPHELVRRRVSPDSHRPAGWEDVEVDLEAPASRCRLLLTNRTEDGTPPRGAVWSVPQILRPTVAGADDTNLILISLDTLRSDHLSGFGYGRPTSPVIDAELIARGTSFTDVSSTFPQTDVSHLSIFTGLYPGAQPKRGRVSREDRLVLLAETLQRAGLETAAFTEDALVSGAFGFWYGFDQFTERAFAHADRGRPTIEDGIRYLESHRDRRFFLFLHTYKTHDPYVPSAEYASLWSGEDAWKDGGPAPWIPEKHREIVDRYDRTIRDADTLVGRLLDSLAHNGLEERTYVVLTSDHGEAFGEHGIAGHGFTPHQEALAVPLIVRGPGIPAGRRIDTPASIADLASTILDLLGAPPLEQAQGISLAGALVGKPLDPSRPVYFSWLRPEAAGVRRGARKFTRTAHGLEGFDLASDPHEWKPDRGDEARAAANRLLQDYEAEGERRRRDLGPPAATGQRPAPAIDERLERSLKALGYL